MKTECERKARGWLIRTVTCLAVILTATAGFVYWVDPFFHFHGPTKGLSYQLHANQERYLNDGIARHFDYDALICGTSMVQNFKTSAFDDLFQTHSVKLAFSGGSYMEVNRLVKQAIQSNKKLKCVVRGLDYNRLVDNDVNAVRSDVDIPTYLYNRNPFDDVNYLFNQDVVGYAIRTLLYTVAGRQTTSFDDYGNWMDGLTAADFGHKALQEAYSRPPKSDREISLDQAVIDKMTANLEQNVIATARDNPDITFYIFFPPYSILYFDEIRQEGKLELFLKIQRYAIEQLLTCENIRLFSFFDDFELVCNLDNYKDKLHYGDWVSLDLMQRMKTGQDQLTKKNAAAYFERFYAFYRDYDYDTLYKELMD